MKNQHRFDGAGVTGYGCGKGHGRFRLLLLALALAWTAVSPLSAAEGLPADTSILQKKIDWVVTDLTRLVEEMRRGDNPASRELLASDVEDILYRDVTFRLLYSRTGKSSQAEAGKPVEKKNLTARLRDPHLRPAYALAFAMAGLARAYEGYPAASAEYLEQARSLDPSILQRKVRIDSFEPERTVSEWLQEAREKAKGPEPFALHFYVRSLEKETVRNVNRYGIRFDTGRSGFDSFLSVAERDFLKGISRYSVAAMSRPSEKASGFTVFLPAGTYSVATGSEGEFQSRIRVDAKPDGNFFVLEGVSGGLVVYPVPTLESLEDSLRPTSPAAPDGEATQGETNAPR